MNLKEETFFLFIIFPIITRQDQESYQFLRTLNFNSTLKTWKPPIFLISTNNQ